MKLAVIGYPIKHSKSPIIHKYWLNQCGINGSYEAIEIRPDSLEKKIKELVSHDFDGFNVTIPFKTDIINLCDNVDDAAQNIGAVNTAHIRDGKLFGFNTDAYGFIQNIKSSQPDFKFENKIALVLGAGGAANAVLYGLINQGVEKIYLSNRTRAKAEALQYMAPEKIEIVDWDCYQDVFVNTDILVNSTALGMVGQPPLNPDLSSLKSGALVTDIVYNPLLTDLLKSAKDKQFQYVTGIRMLVYQAQKAFEIWTGTLPIVDKKLMEQL